MKTNSKKTKGKVFIVLRENNKKECLRYIHRKQACRWMPVHNESERDKGRGRF